MDSYSSDNEQFEALRNFFRENGKAILFGIVIGGGAIWGWRFWQSHQVDSANTASNGYEMVVKALESDTQNAENAAISFISNNKNNYGAMAALELAKHLVNKGDLAGAQKQLEVAVANAKDAELLSLMNLRIARLQFAQNQADAAMATLAKVTANSWTAEANLVRGNIYLSQGKTDEAKQAYNAGLNANPSTFVESQLKLQLENLGM